MNERPNWPGSKWWKFDLHAHTPASHDFRGDAADFESWLNVACDAGMDAIAITDHNTADGIDRAREAAARIENPPVIFPGVELTASDGTHLLLIADPDAGRDDVLHLLSKSEIPPNMRGDKNSRSILSVESILEECGEDAVIIAAHVNVCGSLIHRKGQQRIKILNHQKLSAAEVHPDHDFDSSWLDGSRAQISRRIPQVHSSDSHRAEDVGKRFTWMKMTKRNLEGLRLALMDGESSLIPAKAGDGQNPNTPAALSIEKIAVRKAKHIGQETEEVFAFNPWLNAIIGGRGTGKSTLVDFCRKTLRRDDELERVDRALLTEFNDRMSPGVLLEDDTAIEMVYSKDRQRFRLAWDSKGASASISRLDGDNEIPEKGNIRQRFPARIYSQKQLFSLAQNPDALLDVIDEAQDARSSEIKRRISQLENAYLSRRAEARSALSRAESMPDRIADMSDAQRKLDVFEQGGHSSILGVYRFRRRMDGAWNTIVESAEKSLDSARDAAANLALEDLDFGSDAQDDAPNKALARAHQSIASIMDNLRRNLTQSVAQASREIEGIRAGADAAEWNAAVETSQTEYEAAVSQLRDAGVSDPTEYGELLNRAAELRKEIGELRGERDRAESLEMEAADILAQCREERRQLSVNRNEFTSKISSDTLNLRVDELSRHGDQNDFAARIGEILGISAFQPDREAIADMIHPPNGGAWDWRRLDNMVSKMRLFISGGAESWDSKDKRFETSLKKVDPERIDRLAFYAPDDSVHARFKERRRKGWKALSQGSPGQKTAALLAFVLSFGNEPIILDQPEDDLDNALIYELLVNRFKETKRERQIIVVTHNPNIVVHGDSELVISLEVPSGQTVVNRQGGLQEQDVRDEICRVMEGGREAFEARYRRIMPQGDAPA